MTATVERAPLASAGGGRALRKAKSTIATIAIVASFVVALIPLTLIIGYVISRGASVIDADFLTGDLAYSARATTGGMAPAIVGTLLITGAATLLAVPLGVLGGIWLHEYGGDSRFAVLVRFLAEVMTGVPSIVMGLFIYTFVVLKTKQPNGFAGALALACLMLPVVIRTTEEMLRLVPGEQREASYALGGRRAKTILRIVLPAALPGIVSGALLAVARAAGETAPLLFVIGSTATTNTSLFNGPNTALSVQIFGNATSPFVAAQDRAWGAALTLIAIVFFFTIVARLVTALYSEASRMTTTQHRSPEMPDIVVSHAEGPTESDAGSEPRPEPQREMVFVVRGLEVAYSGLVAVSGVDLDVAAGEITAFIGPSGCGKTTVLRCFNRMHDITPGAVVRGRVEYHGEDLYAASIDAAEVRRRIGMVFQKPNPFPKSIYENVAYGPKINRSKESTDDVVERALTQAALWDEVKTKLKKSALGLSGGQQQRLCIARALAVEPDVVLMDEPCSALDPIATSRIEDLMAELKREYTIVIVTHNMQQAARVSDMTAFFTAEVDDAGHRSGKLVEYAKTETIFTSPSDSRTEGYITGRFG